MSTYSSYVLLSLGSNPPTMGQAEHPLGCKQNPGCPQTSARPRDNFAALRGRSLRADEPPGEENNTISKFNGVDSVISNRKPLVKQLSVIQ